MTFNVGDRVAQADTPTIVGTITLVYPDFGQGVPGYEVHWDHNINPDSDTIYTARSLAPAHPAADHNDVPETVVSGFTVDHAYEADKLLAVHSADEHGKPWFVSNADALLAAHVHAQLATAAAIERQTDILQEFLDTIAARLSDIAGEMQR